MSGQTTTATQQASETSAPAAGRLAARAPSEGRVLLVLALLIVSALAWWVWRDWQSALRDAGLEFQHLAQTNTLPLVLAARDARRTEESLDAILSSGRRVGPAVLRQELGERFKGGEIADYLPADAAEMPLSTSDLPLDAASWRKQLQRVTVVGQPVFGWAYLRGQEWFLPVIFRRADDSHIVVSLPTRPLMASWVAPSVTGETPMGMRGFDDRILLRQPFTPEMMGADASNSASAKAARDALQRGETAGYVVTTATETDSVHRLIAWAELPGTGLTMLVGGARDDLVARWLRQRGGSHALALALLLSGFFVVGWSRSRLQAAAQADAQARRTAERTAELMRHALDASRDTTWQLDLTTGAMNFDADLQSLLGLPTDAAAAAQPAARHELRWLLQHTPEADGERLLEAVRRTCTERAAIYEQFSVQAPGAQAIHFILKGGVARDRHPRLAVGTLRDVTRLVDSQAAAARNLQTLQRMCLLARIGPWTADPQTGLIEMGPGAREIYGMAPDSPAGLLLDFPGADAAAMAPLVAARRRLLSEGIGYDLVLPLQGADGSQRWVRSTAVAVHSASGKIVRIDGALQDVSDTMLARRQLQVSEERQRELALVVLNSSQLLLMTDTQQRITWCNATFERVSGYALHEILGQRPGALLQRGQTPPAVRQRMRRAIDAEEPVRGVRVQNFGKAGQPYWVDLEIVPVFSPSGQLQSYFGLQTDVTADIEQAQALAQTQARFDLATHNANIGIWERSFVTRQAAWNDVMFRLTGCPIAEGVPRGARLQQRIHRDDRETTVNAFRRAARNPAVLNFEFECRFEASPGEVRWLRNQCVFDRDAQGRATRVVGTLLDISVAHELSGERRARAEAEARSAAKTAFLSSMSHELRTPLNAVIGYAQIINSSKTTDVEKVRARVQRIETAGWHLLALIDDILDLARIEGGNAAIEQKPVALGDVLADAVDLIAEQADKAGIDVHVTAADAWVLGDTRRLRQVLANLLSNAVKYNVKGGAIHVQAERLDQVARVEVRDTGLGMTPEQLAQMYEPFNRLGRETSAIQGTGIGLTITRTLVEQMGGTMEASSLPGQGSLFRLTLPLAALPNLPGIETPVPSPALTHAARPIDVLCVEDNEVNAIVLEESVRHFRPLWTVRHAGSLASASQAVRARVPDVVFLDQNLPDGFGLAWLAQPEQSSLLEHAKVVMLTADAITELRQRALAQGVTLFMHKPFDLAELKTLLETMTGSVDVTGLAAQVA